MRDLKRMFANAFVRRVVYVIVAAGLALVTGLFDAKAHEGTAHTSQSEAYQHCMTMAGSGTAPSAYYDYVCYPQTATAGSIHVSLSLSYYTSCGVNKKNPSIDGTYVSTTWGKANCIQSSKNFYFTKTGECAAGWNEAEKKCFPSPAECLAKNDTLKTAIMDTARSTNGCNDGCATSMGTEYTESVITVNGIEARAFHGKFKHTGATCTEQTKAPEAPEPECFDIEGTTTCKRQDGKLCHKTPAGNFHCWAPGEVGEKNDGPSKQKRSPGPEGKLPDGGLILPSGDVLAPVGPEIKSTETTPGKPPASTTVTNYITQNGTNAAPDGGAGTGTPPADGSGGGTVGSGDGAGDGDSDAPGVPGAVREFGRLPGAEDRTLAGTIGSYQARVGAAPFVSAASDFFVIQASGTCPTWQIPATDWTPAISADFWCAPGLSSVWTMIGYCLLLVYGFVAFRWAVL